MLRASNGAVYLRLYRSSRFKNALVTAFKNPPNRLVRYLSFQTAGSIFQHSVDVLRDYYLFRIRVDDEVGIVGYEYDLPKLFNATKDFN